MTYYDSTCRHCGAALLPTDEAELCPDCEVNFEAEPLPPPPKPLPPPPPKVVIVLPARRVIPVPAKPSPEIPGHDLHETIGIGGMGQVRRARQDSLQRDVALKIAIDERNTPEDRDRFLREARVLAQLDHPNIVPIYDFGRDEDGRCFYTMKMVHGRTLSAILAAVCDGEEVWALERLLEVFRKVCDAVAFAHARGVIHRDLKPDNVMVGEFGEVLVVDWGLAGNIKTFTCVPAQGLDKPPESHPSHATASPLRPPAIDSTVELTMEGEVVGTPQYMSPEQASAHPDLDERCDIYALGGILHTILTLYPPLRKSSLEVMLEKVRTGEIEPFEDEAQPAPVSTVPWHIPPSLSAVVRKAMALAREDRFQTVGELAADVDAYVSGFATSAEEVSYTRQLWLLIKRQRTISISALVLLVLSAAFVVKLMASERRATENAQLADQKKEAALKSEHAANKSARVAQAAGSAAKSSETKALESMARAQIASADSAYAINDTAQMRAMLNEVPEELHDSTWHYLDARTDDRQALLKCNDEGFLIGSTAHPTQPGVFTAATSADHRLIVDFEAKTGKILRFYSQRGGWVRGLSYSPDASLIVLTRIMGDGISVHRVSDGKELRHWKTDNAFAAAFLPDGKRFLQTGSHGCVLWDATDGRELWKSPHGQAHLLLPGGALFISVGLDRWRLHTTLDGSVLETHEIKPTNPVSASLSPDGSLLVVYNIGGILSGYRVADGSLAFETAAGDNVAVERTAFTPDGRRFVSVANTRGGVQAVQLRDAATGRTLRYLRGGTGGLEWLTIHPLSGDVLVTGPASATWALPKFREPSWRLFRAGEKGGFLGDDLYLGMIDNDPLTAIDLRTGAAVWKPSRRAMSTTAVTPDGRFGVAQIPSPKPNSRDFVIFRSDGEDVFETGQASYVTDAAALAINCNGTRVAMSGAWGNVGVRFTDTGAELPKPEPYGVRLTNALAWHGTDPHRLLGIFNRFGRRGMAGNEDWILAFDSNTGKCVTSMRNPTPMNCLAVEPRGTRLAEAGDDKIVRIRDAGTLEILHSFRAHDAPITALAWSPGGHIIATGSADRTVRLWNVETGKMIEELYIGLRETEALYFSPSGKRLACNIPGEKTLIWDLQENLVTSK